ncbi:DUF1799 domain-containing protein [uncultured Alteromonas sp.]|jgi:hypothetical protein|uniref:DUF1799 domain-containing protein n=1 Tax=uncultured Alteromonas sp. TaxID=179113 RepID=UPI0025870147|nr:DUF1799 domain-containing protein [uncultured Alteromonas sp.]
MTEAQIKAQLQADDDFKDRVLELLPENQKAFYWFLDVDDLWSYSEGIRVALDLPAVLADAQACDRTYSHQDYQKLRIISRNVVATLCERAREQQ